MESSGFVRRHWGGQQASARDGFAGTADDDAVHDDLGADGEVLNGEFVLGGDGCCDRIFVAGDVNSVARRQIGKRDEDVVSWVELEGFRGCHEGIACCESCFIP